MKYLLPGIYCAVCTGYCYGQSFKFTDKTFQVGSQITKGELYSPDCQIENDKIEYIDSLRSFLERNEQIAIEIEFHAGTLGSIELNQRRTEVCGKSRLQGFFNHKYPNINQSRIKYSCLGESMPIYSQKEIQKTRDALEQSRMEAANRRTIIRIAKIDFTEK